MNSRENCTPSTVEELLDRWMLEWSSRMEESTDRDTLHRLYRCLIIKTAAKNTEQYGYAVMPLYGD